MRRRELIALLGGAVAVSSLSWPLAAHAQQPARMRRIGVLMSTSADDPESQLRLVALVEGLRLAGWTVGHNVQIDSRWASGDIALIRKYATELLALSPDVIVAGGRAASVVPEIQQTGRGMPIVFVQGVDPVGTGYVASLARPGGNVTGFTQFEYTLSGKWLELLREVAPGVTRAAVLRELGAAGIGQWAVIQAAASPLAVELSPVNARDPAEIERAVAAFAHAAHSASKDARERADASEASGPRGDSIVRAHSASGDARERAGDTRPEPGSSAREPNGGLIVVVSSAATVHRDLIIALAAKHRLPAIYPYRYFVTGGGLLSYGPDLIGQYRRAASYVDRILKGEKPGDLPIQAPTRYELAINLKTAKALGLEVPAALLARADEVIE
jgi:putative ABC transport system substrate-binding protein